MRQAECLLIVLLAAACIAGCAEDEQAANRRLAGEIDKARRFYGNATALLAQPTYVDMVTGLTYAVAETVTDKSGSVFQGRLTRTETGVKITDAHGISHDVRTQDIAKIEPYESPQDTIKIPASAPAATGTVVQALTSIRPDIGKDALEKLTDARTLLEKALAETPAAAVNLLADAKQLLGQIQVARGAHHAARAEGHRASAETHRAAAVDLLVAAENSYLLAQFNESLAGMPRDKIEALGKKITTDAGGVAAKIQAIDGQVAAARKDINSLAQANTALRAKARALRDRSNITTGQKGLDLLVQAQGVERVINANDVKISAGQDSINNLKVDQDVLRIDQKHLALKDQALKQRLADMDKRAGVAAAAADSAKEDAAGNLMLAASSAGKVVRIGKLLIEEERLALSAYADADGFLGQAVQAVEKERQAAGATEEGQKATYQIVTDLAGDEHLASTVALRASAELAMADILASQIDTAALNGALASRIEQTAGKVGQAAPAVAAGLRGYVDVSKAQKAAVENYGAAEKALKKVLDSGLNGEVGRNIRWIYEAQLASAYFNHYQLTGEKGVLGEAETFCDHALAGKEGSPYLTTVQQLRAAVLAAKARP